MTIDREKVLQTAQVFVQRKKYDRAVAEYHKLIQQEPDDARVLLKIGDLQSKMGAHADAIATYERVGRQYARQGFSLKAIAVYKQIREIIQQHVPSLADRYSHITPLLAELYTQLGLVSDAFAAYDEVASRLQKAGQDREAIEVFKKLVALDSNNPLPHLRIAEAYSRIKDNEHAVSHFGAAADVLVQLGRVDDALKVLERLLHHRPDAAYSRQAAELYLSRNQPNDGMLALAKLQVCFQADPKDLETLILLARAFTAIAQPAKALEVQKETARIAKEQGNVEVLRQAVDALLQAAPDDEVVQKLAAASAEVGHASTRPSAGAIPLSDAEVEEIQDVEEVAPQAAAAEPTPADDLETLLAESDSLCAAGQHELAMARLDGALQHHPDVIALRRRLRDILYELGEFDRTADEMVRIAQVFVAQGAPEYAAEELQAIFTFLPDHPVARQMLHSLGYAVPGEDVAAAAPPSPAESSPAPTAVSQPLPSYDLDESGGAARGSAEANDAPLPSFALEDDPADIPAETQAVAAPAPPEAPAAASSAQTSPIASVEEALEEAEFFISRGLLKDARDILEEQLQRHPNHPLLNERLQEIEPSLTDYASSGTRERPSRVPLREVRPIGATSDRAFDIAASLDALDALDQGSIPMAGDNTVDVEEVFAKFKEGVREQVSESDSQTHYDLGLAYREMDLYADAVDEFEIAARDPKRTCVCCSIIGMIHRSHGNLNAAIDAFIKGLNAEDNTPDQDHKLYYELGDAFEAKGTPSEAVYYFKKIAHANPSHDDPRGSVSERLRALQAAEKRSAARAQAASTVDEFDAAFDAALSGGSKR